MYKAMRWRDLTPYSIMVHVVDKKSLHSGIKHMYKASRYRVEAYIRACPIQIGIADCCGCNIYMSQHIGVLVHYLHLPKGARTTPHAMKFLKHTKNSHEMQSSPSRLACHLLSKIWKNIKWKFPNASISHIHVYCVTPPQLMDAT